MGSRRQPQREDGGEEAEGDADTANGTFVSFPLPFPARYLFFIGSHDALYVLVRMLTMFYSRALPPTHSRTAPSCRYKEDEGGWWDRGGRAAGV